MRFHFRAAAVVSLLVAGSGVGRAQQATAPRYLTPPQAITTILEAPPLPAAVVSPSHRTLALVERASMPDIALLARPVLRLAGWRINPGTNGPHRPTGIRGIAFRPVAGGAEVHAALPPGELIPIGFNADGSRYAVAVTGTHGMALWMVNPATGRAHAVTDRALNAAQSGGYRGDPPCTWAGPAELLCRFVVTDRGAPPQAPAVPTGPNVQQNLGKVAPVRTYEDMLGSPHDEALFAYYFTSQLAWVEVADGQVTPLGTPGLFEDAVASPDGRDVLVARIERPFSWLVPSEDFPKTVAVWNRQGAVVRKVADVPLADSVPIGGVVTGPRDWQWNPSAPATVVWAEALDGGDPHATVPFRDRVLSLPSPFTGQAAELMKTVHRFQSIDWTDAGVALVTETDRPTRKTWTWILDGLGRRAAQVVGAPVGGCVQRSRPAAAPRRAARHDRAAR